MSKGIQFTNNKYGDLFRISDGAVIQIEFSSEPVIKTYKCIGDYHTKVGSELFHICQFTEMMEHIGAKCYPEDEVMDGQTVWKVGQNHYLALQTSEDGYDYTLYGKNFNETGDGQLDDPKFTVKEARKEILDNFKLGRRDLVAIDYDGLLRRVEQTEAERISSVFGKLKSRKQSILGNKQSSEMFFNEKRWEELR